MKLLRGLARLRLTLTRVGSVGWWFVCTRAPASQQWCVSWVPQCVCLLLWPLAGPRGRRLQTGRQVFVNHWHPRVPKCVCVVIGGGVCMSTCVGFFVVVFIICFIALKSPFPLL